MATALLSTGSTQQPNGGVLELVTLTNINTDLTNVASGAAIADNGIGTTQLAANTVQVVTVPLTLVQMRASNTAPVTLLAAQGAGTLIEVISLTIEAVYGSAAFVGGGAIAAYLGTNSGGVLASATIAATFLTTFAASQVIRVAGAQAVAASTTVLNKALVLANPTADFTSGTAATGIVKLVYRVHSGL